jgi:hypothetical protein
MSQEEQAPYCAIVPLSALTMTHRRICARGISQGRSYAILSTLKFVTGEYTTRGAEKTRTN